MQHHKKKNCFILKTILEENCFGRYLLHNLVTNALKVSVLGHFTLYNSFMNTFLKICISKIFTS